MTLTYYKKRYEIIRQGTFPANRKKLMLASLINDMESAFNIPLYSNPEWEKENEEIIALYRQVSNSKNL